MATDQELKISRMTKRSMNKKIFSRPSYKLREFVLTPFHIKYFEVSGGNRGKEKGRIALANVKYVEKVIDDDLDGKKNVLQIAYVEDANAANWFLLYIVAPTQIERDDWISLIRFYTKERGAVFLPRYHPGVWKRPGRYSCCDDINRRSIGCQHTSDSSNSQIESGAAGINNAAAPPVPPNEPRRFSGFPGVLPVVTSAEIQTPSAMQPLGAIGIGNTPPPQQQSVGIQSKPIPPIPTQQQQQSNQIIPQTQPGALPGTKILLPSNASSPALTSTPMNPVIMNPFTQQQLFQQQLLAQQAQHSLSMLAAAQPHLQQQQIAAVAAVASRRPVRGLPQSPGGQSFDWVGSFFSVCFESQIPKLPVC
ncbi:unnamed protein product [Hymenolepis diminuta]|uniref:PH domain-containing protein n=1 Tax=Hymenolepis diminuta TaxID=6216 RepID=A0A0R3SEM5_HYMDI|nr:unnamed protein product [Hymenolepis diminuta]